MRFRGHKGATILEIMLALGLSALFVVLGIKLYQVYQNTLQVQQLKYNVDQLTQALGAYFQANCAAGDFSPKPPDILSPYPSSSSGITYPPTANNYYAVSIATKLLSPGYLSQWSANNPLVDPSGGEQGYIIQLNPKTLTTIPANACVVIQPGTACVPITPASNIPATQGEVVYWELQVAVKMKNPSNISSYHAALDADCISGETAGSSPTTVDACPSANSSKNYLVWTRTPSFASVQTNSVFNTMMLLLKQFNLQYTHDQNYELNVGYSTTTTPAQAPVYYLCGG